MTLLRRSSHLPGLLALGIVLGACTAAQLTAFDQAIQQGSAALVPVENLACSSATLLDPTGATAICAAVDTTGAAVGAAFVVAEDAASIAALLAKTAPKSPAVGVVLQTALSARVAARKAP